MPDRYYMQILSYDVPAGKLTQMGVANYCNDSEIGLKGRVAV